MGLARYEDPSFSQMSLKYTYYTLNYMLYKVVHAQPGLLQPHRLAHPEQHPPLRQAVGIVYSNHSLV